LGLQGVLHHLHDDLLARLQQLADPLTLAARAPAARDLDARHHDVIDVQEAVLLDADVDERGLEAGQDVVDPALVDVSDYRAAPAPLYVELPDAPALGHGALAGARSAAAPAALRCAVPLSGRLPLRLEDGDSCFATVDRDEHLLSQKFLSCD